MYVFGSWSRLLSLSLYSVLYMMTVDFALSAVVTMMSGCLFRNDLVSLCALVMYSVMDGAVFLGVWSRSVWRWLAMMLMAWQRVSF